MTEQEWLSEPSPVCMIFALRGRISRRKLRLFACACCRLAAADLLGDASCRHALEVAELYADGLTSAHVLAEARQATERSYLFPGGHQLRIVSAVRWAAAPHLFEEAARLVVTCLRGYLDVVRVFRHVAGNLFRPAAEPACWPSAVVQLAGAIYEGADAGFALHDALLEAGHPQLAEHFRCEQRHPKGCWVVDLILGKS